MNSENHSSSPAQPNMDGIEVAQAALTDNQRRKRDVGSSGRQEKEVPQGLWPVVEFKNGHKMLLPPMEFSVQNPTGQDEAVRVQVPLILAWA
jgi:hypothetical protein